MDGDTARNEQLANPRKMVGAIERRVAANYSNDKGRHQLDKRGIYRSSFAVLSFAISYMDADLETSVSRSNWGQEVVR